MHRVIIPCAIILALISGVVLNETRLVALAPIVPAARVDQNTGAIKIVTQFYAGVNEAIASGDVTSVSGLLAEDLVDHSIRPGLRPDQTSLLDLVQTLHGIDANLRLIPSEMIGQGDLVSAQVRVSLPPETSFLGQTITASRLWSPFDLFRVEGNRITEHWDDASGLALFARLLDISVPIVVPESRAVRLERWSYAPATAETWEAAFGPLVLYVDVGALMVDVASTEGSLTRRLLQGESIVVPERGRLAVRNDEQSESVALVVKFFSAASPGAGGETLSPWTASASPARGDARLSTGIASGGPNGGREPLSSSVTSASPEAGANGPLSMDDVPRIVHTTLASGGLAKLSTGQASVSISRLILAPDTDLAPHAVGILEMIGVERGTLALALDDGEAWVSQSPSDGIHSSDGEAIHVDGGAVIVSGMVTGSPFGSHEPLGLLIVTMEPPKGSSTD